jgi:hypothetical protein
MTDTKEAEGRRGELELELGRRTMAMGGGGGAPPRLQMQGGRINTNTNKRHEGSRPPAVPHGTRTRTRPVL